MPEETFVITENAKLFGTGWYKNRNKSNILQVSTVQTIDEDDCRKILEKANGNYYKIDSLICTSVKDVSDLEFIDPVCFQNRTQVGLKSFVGTYPNPNSKQNITINVLTKLSYFTQWVNDTIKDNN